VPPARKASPGSNRSRSARQWALLLAAAAGVLALALAGCPQPPAKQPAAPGTSGQPAAGTAGQPAAGPDPATASACFAFIGDFRTFLRPCGCTPTQPGGVPRLGSIIKTGRALLAQPDAPAVPADIPPEQVAQLRQMLGLPEAGGAAAASAPQRLWLVECGNFNWVGVHNEDLRLETYLNVLQDLGCRAIVPGAGELVLQEKDARALSKTQLPLVSCNLTLNKPLFKLQEYVELAPGWYVTGVSSWAALGAVPPQNSWWTMNDPVEGVRNVLDKLPQDARLVVVAAYQPQEVIDSLAKLPLAALIGDKYWPGGTVHEASGATGIPPTPQAGERALPAPVKLPAPPPRGAFLPLVRLYNSAAGLQGDTAFVPVDMAWPDDAPVQARLDKLTGDLRDIFAAQRAEENKAYAGGNPNEMQPQFMPPDQQQLTPRELKQRFSQPAELVGSGACLSCHAAAAKVWTASGHAHALDTLTAHQAENSVDCLQCHTVGLYIAPGYDPNDMSTVPREKFGAVGCESCHGPGSQHVAAAKLAKLTNTPWEQPDPLWNGERYSIERGTLKGCTGCHDSYNSPKFEAQAYWAKIKH
jgi:hypothetical protein